MSFLALPLYLYLSPFPSPFSSAAVTATGGVDISAGSLAKIAEMLNPKEVSISKASGRLVDPILMDMGIQAHEPQPRATSLALPTSAGWAERLPGQVLLVRGLQQYLTALGVNFGNAEGFQLVDVHTSSDLLNVTVDGQAFTGGTDAMVIPWRQGVEHARSRARVVVDFKTAKVTYGDVRGQMTAEFITSNALSDQDVLVLFTDLNTFGHIIRGEGKFLRYWRDCTVHQALKIVRDFLVEECSIDVEEFTLETMKGPPATKKARLEFFTNVHKLREIGRAHV